MVQKVILLLSILITLEFYSNAQDFKVDHPVEDIKTFLAVPGLEYIYSCRLESENLISVIFIDKGIDSIGVYGTVDVEVPDSAQYSFEWINALSGDLIFADKIQSLANGHNWKLALNVESFNDYLILNIEKNVSGEKFEAHLKVVDIVSGQPVYRAEVRFNNDILLTNHEGEAVFDNISEIPWIFTIEHDNYFSYTDSVFIAADTTMIIPITEKLANLKMIIRDSSGVIPNQAVTLGGMVSISDFNGEVWYFNIPARKEYDFTIQREGWITFSDTVYLETDTVLNITLEALTGLNWLQSSVFQLFPNPAEDHIYITTDAEKAEISVYNMQGKAQYTWNVSHGRTRLDIPSGWSGIYIMEIRTRNEIRHKRIVIRGN